jgi:HlyD family secretion protein
VKRGNFLGRCAVAFGGMIMGMVACGEPEDGLTLRVAPVLSRDIRVSASAAGVVEPVTTVEVKSKASGEIVEVLIDEGEEVQRDQLLVRVDPRIPANAVVQAEADSVVARAELANAEAQLERAEQLHESQSITDLEMETARLARATAYAALVRARRALEDAKIAFEDTEVRAPSDGVVLGRNVEVGTVIASASRDVSGGAVLLRMAELDTVQVRALVDETDIGMIQPGMPVTITVASYPNRPFRGDVLRVGAEAIVDQNVTMFPVLVRIANRDRLLRPGMNAEVEVLIGEVHDAPAVPNAALRNPEEIGSAAALLGLSLEALERQLAEAGGFDARREVDGEQRGGDDGGSSAAGNGAPTDPDQLFGGQFVVFALCENGPRAVPVRTGLTDYDYTAVLDGLAVGDTVIVLPTAGLLEAQERRQQWIRRRVGSPLGGN